jgi:hypothetical protein
MCQPASGIRGCSVPCSAAHAVRVCELQPAPGWAATQMTVIWGFWRHHLHAGFTSRMQYNSTRLGGLLLDNADKRPSEPAAWQCYGSVKEVLQLCKHLVSGVSGCDSRTLEAVRRTGLVLPTLLPAASTCTGGRVSFSLRRSRARSALQLQGHATHFTQYIQSCAMQAQFQSMHACSTGCPSGCRMSTTAAHMQRALWMQFTCGSRTADRPRCADPSGRRKLPVVATPPHFHPGEPDPSAVTFGTNLHMV